MEVTKEEMRKDGGRVVALLFACPDELQGCDVSRPQAKEENLSHELH